tara:strand:- start:200 stop:496 length:297 start_codon:yes stop_codon:yes gene_type:complete
MMNEKLFGVFCKKDKTFYYLECGQNHVVNTVPRITKTLFARGIIELDADAPSTYTQYDVLTIKEAKDKEMKMTPIYINDHVRKLMEEKEETKQSSKWK